MTLFGVVTGVLRDAIKELTGRAALEQRLWAAECSIDGLKEVLKDHRELIDSLCASALVNLNGIDEETRNAATRASHKAGYRGSRMVSVELRRKRLRELDEAIAEGQATRNDILNDYPELRSKP